MKLKNYILIGSIIFSSILLIACNQEDENIYKWENIEFFLEENDGISYNKENLKTILVYNNTDKDIIAPRYNIYNNYQEFYHFVPEKKVYLKDSIYTNIAINIWYDGTIENSINKYTYTEKKTIISNLYELSPKFTVPPHKYLEVKGEITIMKLTLTYRINYQNTSTNERVSVKGKYYFYKPININYQSSVFNL
ncbi:MAG: ETX/MTX2 family pore-forming toxin [Bacilli bacterium]|nr:ETX/MTX2 family pore-forming toxin [Bacilli bacterium]